MVFSAGEEGDLRNPGMPPSAPPAAPTVAPLPTTVPTVAPTVAPQPTTAPTTAPESSSQSQASSANTPQYYDKTSVIDEVLQTSALSGRSMFDLLYDRDELAQKKAEAKQDLIDMFGGYLPGSTEWWVDQVCASKIPKVGDGFAFVDVEDTIRMVAHVEAEKQLITSFDENETTAEVISSSQNVYKVSFRVENRDNRNRTLYFNVYLDGVNLFSQNIKVKNGKTYSREGSDTIVQTSDADYSTVCLVFTNREILVRQGEDFAEIRQVCNEVVNNGHGVATIYTPPGYASPRRIVSTGSGSGSGSGSSGPSINPNI